MHMDATMMLGGGRREGVGATGVAREQQQQHSHRDLWKRRTLCSDGLNAPAAG